MKEKLVELFKVKSLITLFVFGVFSYLAIVGKVEPKDFMTILAMVATYYFARQEKPKTE